MAGRVEPHGTIRKRLDKPQKNAVPAPTAANGRIRVHPPEPRKTPRASAILRTNFVPVNPIAPAATTEPKAVIKLARDPTTVSQPGVIKRDPATNAANDREIAPNVPTMEPFVTTTGADPATNAANDREIAPNVPTMEPFVTTIGAKHDRTGLVVATNRDQRIGMLPLAETKGANVATNARVNIERVRSTGVRTVDAWNAHRAMRPGRRTR